MRILIAPLLAFATVTCAQAQAATPPPTPTRGQLLYANHCVECHNTQMHWRAQRLARDWNSLKGQVRRFQDLARLDWNDDDIEAVARHLNDTIYRFPQPHARR